MLKDGNILGTDEAGRTALPLMLDPWTLDRVLAFDADATDLEDADAEPLGAKVCGAEPTISINVCFAR